MTARLKSGETANKRLLQSVGEATNCPDFCMISRAHSLQPVPESL
jgi:hypothetical protein